VRGLFCDWAKSSHDAEVAIWLPLSGLVRATLRQLNYVTGAREPDLATLVRICGVHGASPNDHLGTSKVQAQPIKRSHRLPDL
jgi:hypothetical protein